eukprot:scaffold70690_cov47-Phaeocystis_antarctica.AAC.2
MGHRRLRHHPRRFTFTAATLATASPLPPFMHTQPLHPPPSPPFCRHAVAASASEFGLSLRMRSPHMTEVRRGGGPPEGGGGTCGGRDDGCARSTGRLTARFAPSSPLEARGDKLPAENPAYKTPDRASSPEIIATSTDAPSGGMARKTAHERYLGRRRSSQSEELTTNGASPRRGAHPKLTDETRDRASSPEIIATSTDAPSDGMARRTTHERYLGRRRSSQSEEMTTNGASPRRGRTENDQ